MPDCLSTAVVQVCFPSAWPPDLHSSNKSEGTTGKYRILFTMNY